MIHIYGPDSYNSTSVRTWCPAHNRLHLARVTSYYDRWCIAFDCGAYVDASEGAWCPDSQGPTYSKYEANTGLMRQITKQHWAHWQPHISKWMKRIPAERDRMAS